MSKSYNDTPEWVGFLPDCPECGTEMGYNYYDDKFKCPSCGHLMDADSWDYTKDSRYEEPDIPYGCEACGGPYPNCKDSCNLFDT